MAEAPAIAFRGETPSPDTSRFTIPPKAMSTIVIFGTTGDLTARKVLPAIYNLWNGGFLPHEIAVVGVARKDKSDSEWRADMCEALKEYSRTGAGLGENCDPFVANLCYHRFNFNENDDLGGLGEHLDDIEAERNLAHHRLYYLATPPEFFSPLIHKLGQAGLIRNPSDDVKTRVVIEKPFGSDLESAQALNADILEVLAEEQTFRIDHYLGKETVQNIFAFRFGNCIFEPLFNQHYVDHVQITVAESAGMEGRRGGFYDHVGALRDVVQNHGLQLLSLVAMEPPSIFGGREIRDEKRKVLDAVTLPLKDPLGTWVVRGQYSRGNDMDGYLSEEGVDPNSNTETYVALRLYVDNWRWSQVPFLIRTGKRLKKRVTEVAIQFKHPPTHYFRSLGVELPGPNRLVFRIQPDEAIGLDFNAKPPGMEYALRTVGMDFNYGQAFAGSIPDAYERLLLDALRGDSMLFMRADEIESAWRIITEVMEHWGEDPMPDLYRCGTWGPPSADDLFGCCQGEWRTP